MSVIFANAKKKKKKKKKRSLNSKGLNSMKTETVVGYEKKERFQKKGIFPVLFP